MRVRMEIPDDWILRISSRERIHTHTSMSVCEFLMRMFIPVLLWAPHSPNLSPCGFYLFPKLKLRVKSSNFQTLDSVQKAVADAIKTLTEADFQSYYEA
jgi:hypothetical protein